MLAIRRTICIRNFAVVRLYINKNKRRQARRQSAWPTAAPQAASRPAVAGCEAVGSERPGDAADTLALRMRCAALSSPIPRCSSKHIGRLPVYRGEI